MNLPADEFNHTEAAIQLYCRVPDTILLCFTNKKRRGRLLSNTNYQYSIEISNSIEKQYCNIYI